jgi:pimeloyl-ACP methyl ester carboxylesterase
MTKLHVREWGAGDRVAVLLHGITSSSATWWKVGPAIAARGYRVIAPDLRGHGESERGTYAVSAWADDVLQTVPPSPELALGFSLGGLVLAAAVERLAPRRAVYEDPAWFLSASGAQREQAAANFLARKQWTIEDIRSLYPRWEPESYAGSLRSIALWDPDTVRFEADFTAPGAPLVPSLVVTADPSQLIPPPRAAELRALGFEVRTVPNTGHIIHNDDFAGFWAAIEDWL